MVSKKEPDFPPPGWKVQSKVKNGRKDTYYINTKTHQKFYSKLAVLRYIKDGGVSTKKVQHIKEHTKKTSGKKQVVQANDYEWLPTGWVIERRIRKSGAKAGTVYKCFIDPSTGSKFFSKPEVLRYLGSKLRSDGVSTGKDKEKSVHSPSERSDDSLNADQSNQQAKVSQVSKTRVRKSCSSGKLKIVVERTVDEELPSGWIKETRIKMLGNKVLRRDLFFADPASSLVFRSKLDALRYMETGEISRHAYRRRNGNTEENLAITIFSSKKGDTAKSGTSLQVLAGEGSSRQSIEAPPKARGHEKNGGKKSKTSFRVQPPNADASSPKKSTLSPESANDSQEQAEAKKPLGMTKRTPPAVQDVDAKDASLTKSEPSSVSPENPLAVVIHDYNDRKVRTTKRKIKDGNPPCAPSRSSKRLAGVGAEVVFLPIPIEHALRATNRKPSRTRSIPSIPSLGSVLDEKQEKHQDVDRKNLNEGAPKATSRRKSSTSNPSPSLQSFPNEFYEKCKDAETMILSEGVIPATGGIKSSRSELIACSKSAPDGLHEMQHNIDKEIVLAAQGEPPLKEINDLKFQEGNHHAIDGDEKIVLDIQVEQPVNKIDSKLISLEVQSQRHDQEDLEVKHHTLDVDAKTVLATQEETSTKIDNFTTKHPILVDLNDLQLEAPPGFSGNTKVGTSTVTMKQSLERPMGSSLGSKVENASKGRTASEEPLASTEKQTEQPQSDLCFMGPLWSDPCLEFAYKTLTGAIPFDDNLAIQDYIQYQLRTSEQSPDVCAPNFFRNDEPKLNNNSFGSQEIKQVKNK